MVIYLDGADLETMARLGPKVSGFTTNPTLMKKAGITNYRDFAREVLAVADGKPVSFEVLADDFGTMSLEADALAALGNNVWVKVPITNTKGESAIPLIKALWDVQVNVTAVMTQEQLYDLDEAVQPHHIISVFAGRIMDTGRLPWDVHRCRCPALWASAREVYHVVMAEELGYNIITLTPDLVAKLELSGKNLRQYSLETVRQFHRDGQGIVF